MQKRRFLLAGLWCASAIGAARADEVEDFYCGRNLTILVGHEVGTGFDVYSRALARHFGRFSPGKPTVGVQNMQGASGMTAANWLYNLAPRDGTVIATYTHSVILEPLLGDASARFDPLEFSYIGTMDEGLQLCDISKNAGIARFDDLMKREVQFGGSAAGTAVPLSQTPNAVKNLTGAKIKLIQGYRGSYDIKLAIDRGEIFGICGLPLSTARTEWRDLLDAGRVKPLILLGRSNWADLAGLPVIYDYAKTDDDKQVFEIIFRTQGLGRVYMNAPDVPSPRIQALRTALLDTMADLVFLAEAKTAQIDIARSSGEVAANLMSGSMQRPQQRLSAPKRRSGEIDCCP